MKTGQDSRILIIGIFGNINLSTSWPICKITCDSPESRPNSTTSRDMSKIEAILFNKRGGGGNGNFHQHMCLVLCV